MEITDAQKEREAIAALRDAEARVNHSVRWPNLNISIESIENYSFIGINHFLTCSSYHSLQKTYIK